MPGIAIALISFLILPMTDPQSPSPPSSPQATSTESPENHQPDAPNRKAETSADNLFDKTIVSALNSFSSLLFIYAWGATLAIAVLAFSVSYYKASNWLNRGRELGKAAANSCVDEQFQLDIDTFTHEPTAAPTASPGANQNGETNSNASAEPPETEPGTVAESAGTGVGLDRDLYTALVRRQTLSVEQLALIEESVNLQTAVDTLEADLTRLASSLEPSLNNPGGGEVQTTGGNNNNQQTPTAGVAADIARLEADLTDKQATQQRLQEKINEREQALKKIDVALRNLGIPRISVAEMIRLKKQNDTIQQRIYVHYDIIRNYYGIHQAGSVGAALALLLASAVLIFITGDIWEGKIQKNPHLILPLILFGGTYILCLNLPKVLSAEEIYQTNLTQYIGYVNLEQEICTVLATERFVGDSDQPDTLKEIEFNRLIHSVERRMQGLNSRTMTSNVEAIDRLRFNLESLNYPRKDENPEAN